MDRLSDDTVITIFKFLKPRELESVASASRALSERDAVWHELARELVGTRGGGGRPSGRSSARLRLTGKQTYAKVHALRLSNSEEARNKFDGAKKVSLAALRSVLKDWSPLDLNARGSSGCSFLHSIISDARLTKGQTLQCARELVDRWGADVNVSNDLDLSPLHSAAALGDLRTVEFLVERGASLGQRGAHPNGFVGAPVRPGQRARTAKEWAETFGNADVVDFIAAREPAAAAAGEPAATAAGEPSPSPRKKRRKRRELFCYPTCRHGRENAGNMIHCEGGCERWFHLECVNMSDEAFKTMVRDEDAKFVCPECETGVAFRYEPVAPPAEAPLPEAPPAEAPPAEAPLPGAPLPEAPPLLAAFVAPAPSSLELEADALGGWLDAEAGWLLDAAPPPAAETTPPPSVAGTTTPPVAIAQTPTTLE